MTTTRGCARPQRRRPGAGRRRAATCETPPRTARRLSRRRAGHRAGRAAAGGAAWLLRGSRAGAGPSGSPCCAPPRALGHVAHRDGFVLRPRHPGAQVLEAAVDRRLQERRVHRVVAPQDEPLGHDPVGRVPHPASVTAGLPCPSRNHAALFDSREAAKRPRVVVAFSDRCRRHPDLEYPPEGAWTRWPRGHASSRSP
jgi:hypothetical protein